MSLSHEAERFLANTGEIEQVQRAHLLESVVATNSETEFGRAHGFDQIKNVDDYRASVPLAEYEQFRAPVDRIAAGASNVLTAQRAVAFFKTSGSTAAPKLIPVTQGLVRDKARAFGIFWNLVYRDHPTLESGKWIANFGDGGGSSRTESGREVLSETTFWNRRMQMFQAGAGWPLPPEIRKIKDPELRYYAVARIVLAGRLDGIMCLNPSTLSKFCRTIENHGPDLVEGIRNGTFGGGLGQSEELEALKQHLPPPSSPNAKAVGKAIGGSLSGFWPDLELAICWQSELVRPYLNQLEGALEGVGTRDYITQGSEAIMAIPLRDWGSGGMLAYTCHHYEFIPESQCDQDDPDTVLPWELEIGQTYELVVSTSGGLYRYRIGDCFRVTEMMGKTPHLDFLYRKGKTSSITGEKLTEMQIIQAAKAATAVVGAGPAEFLCFPRSEGDPHYGVLVQGVNDEVSREWVRQLDSELQAVNNEYGSKRTSGRLGAPRALLVSAAAFDLLRQEAADPDISIEQVKLGALSRKLDVDAGLGEYLRQK